MTSSVKQKIGFGAVLIGFIYMLSDTLLDLLLELLHLAFEALEFILDVVIEHLFDTGRHATQTITFYILLLLAAFLLYKIGRSLPGWYGALKTDLAAIRCQFTETALDYWLAAPALSRVKWWSALTIGMGMLIWSLLG
jgi:hypothetical protein